MLLVKMTTVSLNKTVSLNSAVPLNSGCKLSFLSNSDMHTVHIKISMMISDAVSSVSEGHHPQLTPALTPLAASDPKLHLAIKMN